MKSSKTAPRPQYGNTERKSGKRSEKAPKLDRKSSRGMIYENEELRLRTININAEVERGQSDIKRLRRENEHLRREIWTLRDECDRLNKRFVKAKFIEHEHAASNTRGSGGSGGCTVRGCDGRHSNSHSDDSDSCDTCKGDDGHCSDECCKPIKQSASLQDIPTKQTSTSYASSMPSSEPHNTHANFDHLSVVSEETMSNSEVLASHNEQVLGHRNNLSASQSTLPSSIIGPLTPMTPIELVANQLNDLQAVVPPLSYFENVIQKHMGSTMGNTPDTATTNSGRVMRHVNGWDYKLESPFAQRKTSNPNVVASPVPQHRYAPPTLTTFVPTTLTSPTIVNVETSRQATSQQASVSFETVPITTNASASVGNSPKHFFAPLKPRLKLNTSLASLANKALIPATVPIIPPPTPSTSTIKNDAKTSDCGTPNTLAINDASSSNQCSTVSAKMAISPTNPPKVTQSPSSAQASTKSSSSTPAPPPPPPIPQRRISPQVSPRHCHRHHYRQQQLQQHQQHQQQQQQQETISEDVASFVSISAPDVAAAGVDGAATTALVGGNSKSPTATGIPGISEILFNTKYLQPQQYKIQQQQQLQQETINVTATTTLPQPHQIHVEKSNFTLTKLNEPIYATAQKRSNNLISAVAVTKPLMTTTTTKATRTTSPMNYCKASTATARAPTARTRRDSECQTDSVSLEALLNDIESISEDILAIQLDKTKSRDNLSITMTNVKPNATDITTNTTSTSPFYRPLHMDDKTQKPYRSEVNLQLSHNGTNTTITPQTIVTTTETAPMENSQNGRRARSLERENEDSPLPNMPDPMKPFPDNRAYIGFEHVNTAVVTKSPPNSTNSPFQRKPSSPSHIAARNGMTSPKTGSPNKPPPPLPPVRLVPPGMSIRGSPTSMTTNMSERMPPGSPVHGLMPNKSQLYSSIANAAARRAVYRGVATQMTRSLDTDLRPSTPKIEIEEPKDIQGGDSHIQQVRRNSIATGNERQNTAATGDSIQSPQGVQANATGNWSPTGKSNMTGTPTVTGSCSDLVTMLQSAAIQNLKQTSYSTPNSPHSFRQYGNNNVVPENTENSNKLAPQHNRQVSSTYSTASDTQPTHQRNPSQEDSNHDSALDLTSATATAGTTRSKCSRRHSDGTVITAHRISGTSGGTASHHHRHHHHHHSSSVISANPHHNHHNRRDSNHDTCLSVSDHSGSFPSSRESSASFSMRSNRRKLSISSHTGGKIPWCGCWGNGCL